MSRTKRLHAKRRLNRVKLKSGHIFNSDYMDGLDHAAIRRFKFKVEFCTLTPEGNLHFYNALLKPLLSVNVRLSPADAWRIKSIRNLTPGDFAVAKDQAQFMELSRVTHETLIDSLINESRHKKGIGRRMGF